MGVEILDRRKAAAGVAGVLLPLRFRSEDSGDGGDGELFRCQIPGLLDTDKSLNF
jgi:hypothetical protein